MPDTWQHMSSTQHVKLYQIIKTMKNNIWFLY